MDGIRLAIIVGFPLIWHLAFTGFAYTNAGKHGLSPRKWAVITFCVPLFGFFAYLFARDERLGYDEPDGGSVGPFRIHESRIEEAAGEPADSDDEK